MNKERRKKLSKVIDKLAEIKEMLEEVKDEEEEAFDNLPDGLQYSEKGQTMEGYIEMIEEAVGHIDDAESVIEEI